MNETEFILLDIFYELTNKNTFLLPIFKYLDLIEEITNLPIDIILSIYDSLLENKYIKIITEDKFFITPKGMKELGFKDLKHLIAKNINTITISQLSKYE